MFKIHILTQIKYVIKKNIKNQRQKVSIWDIQFFDIAVMSKVKC